mmetsp:Transcript_6096/g.15542  ORF Transcript_6096/g.15542 Transcript_6096/m.15542 type:complete len:255 (-) Transcript_6096:344-1108(-)
MATRERLASPSGSALSAARLMSASSFASLRASSMPNSVTMLMAFSKSPSPSNWLTIIARSSGLRRSANSVGAVRLPDARSWPWGLPSCSSVCVKSRMSSTTWKARPRCLPYSYMSILTSSVTSLNTAALLQLAAIRLAVLLWDFSRYSSSVRSQLNSAPACEISPSAKSAMTCEISLITSRLSRFARYHEDCANRKSPARMATRVPYSVWIVASPRRVSQSSSTSSCTSDAVWIISVISARRRWRSVMSLMCMS